MDACDGVVEPVDVPLLQREPPAIEHVDLAAVEHAHAVKRLGDG